MGADEGANCACSDVVGLLWSLREDLRWLSCLGDEEVEALLARCSLTLASRLLIKRE